MQDSLDISDLRPAPRTTTTPLLWLLATIALAALSALALFTA